MNIMLDVIIYTLKKIVKKYDNETKQEISKTLKQKLHAVLGEL